MAEYLINPYSFILGEEECDIAPVWYMRCGGHNETTLNQFLNLALTLTTKADAQVDFAYSWDQRHTWILDLEIDATLAFMDQYVK